MYLVVPFLTSVLLLRALLLLGKRESHGKIRRWTRKCNSRGQVDKADGHTGTFENKLRGTAQGLFWLSAEIPLPRLRNVYRYLLRSWRYPTQYHHRPRQWRHTCLYSSKWYIQTDVAVHCSAQNSIDL